VFFVILDLALASVGCFSTTANHRYQRDQPTSHPTLRLRLTALLRRASMPIEDFKTTMKDITPNGVIDQLADQTFDNAKIVSLVTL
jgi:hypothetical protein